VQLVELGVVDNLLKYHVTAGKAALTSDRLKDGMKLTMLNDEKTTILKKWVTHGAMQQCAPSHKRSAMSHTDLLAAASALLIQDGASTIKLGHVYILLTMPVMDLRSFRMRKPCLSRSVHVRPSAEHVCCCAVCCRASEDAASEPGRRLLQANESVFIQSNTNQTAAVLDANYQGGKAIIHVSTHTAQHRVMPASLQSNCCV
jgi:hypothetical protein